MKLNFYKSLLGCGFLVFAMSFSLFSQSNSGFTPLFDGTTLKNWHSYGESQAGNAWKVVDGSIYLDPSNKKDWQIVGGGDLVSNESFDNFHLKLDWKISGKGNSGIIFCSQDEPKKYKEAWYTGPEMQVLDNEGTNIQNPKQKAGGLYDLFAPAQDVTKPVGEWNSAEIILEYPKLTLKLNGVVTVSTDVTSEDFKSRLVASKFKKDPSIHGFLEKFSGHIVLQDHGAAVWYKNIMIKKLPK
ncbi:MAG: DUF1080 domain-containing protein [Alphaproteobacteria bacterium]|nr:DUF1080 domain-containing protein [Alphaproteobacteria bacterium]